MCVAGEAQFSISDQVETLQMGETLLVPASLKEFVIEASDSAELLEVYIK